MINLAILLVATASAAATGERCDGEALTLVLAGEAFDEWPSWCADLDRYVGTTTTASAAARLLDETSYFRTVDCRAAGGRIGCVLEPHAIVEDSELDTSLPFALLEEDIERRVFLRSGVLLDDPERQLAQQVERIRTWFEREGYFRSAIEVRGEPSGGAEPNHGRAIEIDVDSGAPTDLGPIRVAGDEVIGPAEVEAHLRHSWIFGFFPMRFRPSYLEDDVDRLTQAIQERGYPEATVEPKVLGDPRSGEVGLEVTVHAGPKLELVFTGATAFDAEELTALGTFSESGTIDAVEVERTAAAIREAYQRDGFWSAEVEGTSEATEGARVRIHYRIVEGPRSWIRRLRFEGGSLPEGELPRLRTRTASWFASGAWVDAWIASDVRTLQDHYAKAGFGAAAIEASAKLLGDSELEATFRIEEGPKRTVGTLEIDGLPPEVDRAKLLLKLSLVEGAPWDPLESTCRHASLSIL